MKKEFPLADLSKVVERFQYIEQLFPDISLSYPETNVLVLASTAKVLQVFLEYVERDFRTILTSTRITFCISKESFPNLHSLNYPIDSIWFLFFPDRYEIRSENFLQWADQNRKILGNIPFFAFRVFESRLLINWSEPIKYEEENAAGRKLVVSSVAIGDNSIPIEDLQDIQYAKKRLLILILAKIFKHKNKSHCWVELVKLHDKGVASELDKQVLSLKKKDLKGLNGLDSAIINTKLFFDIHSKAQTAKEQLKIALELAKNLDIDLPDEVVESASRQATAKLNYVRHNTSSQEDKGKEFVDFATDFQKFRKVLLRLVDKLIKDSDKRNLQAEVKVLLGIKTQLSEDITVILLGTFSSGKSTFLNSFLRLNGTDSALPTSGVPETATINVLEYAEKDEVFVEFLEMIDLTLFTANTRDKKRFKANKYEIEALLRWIENDYLNSREFLIGRFAKSPQFRNEAKDLVIDFGKKLGLNQNTDSMYTKEDHGFFYGVIASQETHWDESELVNKKAIGKVSNIRFQQNPKLPSQKELKAYFEFVKAPEIALRIREFKIKRKINTLEGLRFADTPGTDSQISHHHTLAKNYIESSSNSPVIYLFDGTRVGGTEDKENLKSLNKDAKNVKERIFFVITKKGLAISNGNDEVEIREKVKFCLKEVGMENGRIYFVDSLDVRKNHGDLEWNAFVNDLNNYINENRTDLLRQRARTLIYNKLNNLRSDYNNDLKDLRGDREARKQKAEIKKRVAEEILNIINKFPTEIKTAKNRLFRGLSFDFLEEINRIDAKLKNFDCGAWKESTKILKIEDIKEIVRPLSSWPSMLKENLENVANNLMLFLRIELDKTRIKDDDNYHTFIISHMDLPSEFSSLELSEIDSKANENTYQFIFSYRPWFESKISALRELLKNKQTLAVKRVEKVFENIVKNYEDQIQAHYTKAFESAQKLTDERDLEKSIREMESRISFVTMCLEEFSAIE